MSLCETIQGDNDGIIKLMNVFQLNVLNDWQLIQLIHNAWNQLMYEYQWKK